MRCRRNHNVSLFYIWYFYPILLVSLYSPWTSQTFLSGFKGTKVPNNAVQNLHFILFKIQNVCCFFLLCLIFTEKVWIFFIWCFHSYRVQQICITRDIFWYNVLGLKLVNVHTLFGRHVWGPVQCVALVSCWNWRSTSKMPHQVQRRSSKYVFQ